MGVTGTPEFSRHESGLYVPDAVARLRQVWTKAELRKLDAVVKLLNSRNIKVMFACQSPQCAETAIQRVPGLGGDYILRCACTDRIFQREF